MANGQSKRYAESGATKSRARSVAAQAASGSSFRARTNILNFPSSSLSLPRTRTTIKSPSSRWRSQNRFHRQTLSEFGRETPGVCIFDRADLERHCQPCRFEVFEPRSRTWLKSRRMASIWPFGWNISLIACRPKSLLKLMNCWCPNGADRRIISVARRS